MNTKEDVAVVLLTMIRDDRAKLESSERSTITAALRLGMSSERIAHLTGASVERVEQLRGGGV